MSSHRFARLDCNFPIVQGQTLSCRNYILLLIPWQPTPSTVGNRLRCQQVISRGIRMRLHVYRLYVCMHTDILVYANRYRQIYAGGRAYKEYRAHVYMPVYLSKLLQAPFEQIGIQRPKVRVFDLTGPWPPRCRP